MTCLFKISSTVRIFFITFSIIILSIIGVITGSAQAQEIPTKQSFLESIAAKLPSFIRASDLVLTNPSVSENDGRKRMIYRFDLSASVTEPLFATVREVGPFVVVVPTMQKDAAIRLTGLLDLTSNGSGWTTGIGLDQQVEKFGKPIDSFGQPTLISGDPETESKLALMRGEADAVTLEALQKEFDATVAALRSEGEAQVLKERERGATDLLAVIAEHATKRGKLIAKQRQQIAELETGLAAERQSLTRQISTAEDVRKLQTRLADTLKVIVKNDAASISEFTTMRSQRLQLLNTLPKTWVGVVKCAEDANSMNNKSTTLKIEFQEAVASGFPASFVVNDGEPPSYREHRGAAAILDKNFSFPMSIAFSAPDLNGFNGALLPEGFTLKLSVDGRMQATEAMMVRWGYGDATPSTCVFDLSG